MKSDLLRFLDDLCAPPKAAPLLTPDAVRLVVEATEKELDLGYSEADVDDLCDRVVATLSRRTAYRT